jgi:uncharacterized membrane protein
MEDGEWKNSVCVALPSAIFYPPTSCSNIMPDAPPTPDLLRSLGKLARGLSAVFWGLPVALILCFTAGSRLELFRVSSLVPAVFALGLLFYGLVLMGDFQKQERPWRLALDRARLLALVNLGLSPFLFFRNRLPEQPLFFWSVALLAVSGLLFLYNLNYVLLRLSAMLPDETLRHEARQFTALNRGLLIAMTLLSAVFYLVPHLAKIPLWLILLHDLIARFSILALVPLLILPLAMTMALLWKTKEVILESVFEGKH